MMESATDIAKYLGIVQGDLPKDQMPKVTEVDLGLSTAGASIGDQYIFENGLRWAEIISEDNDCWVIKHGLVEYEANDLTYLPKHEMTQLIRNGEMVLREYEEIDDILEESLEDDSNALFEDFLYRANRYLLVNENKEIDDFEYDWKHAYLSGLSATEAADEAVALES